jgi:hypothetical protein
MLSMPPGTPPQGVQAAARNFAREEFALKHRYALVLHTDEPHPHMHLVVKAVSEQGVRLNISKATLREWRREFARHLRKQGIAANATERAARGQVLTHKKDGIYRANLRGASTHMLQRTQAVARELAKSDSAANLHNRKLLRTRRDVEGGWKDVSAVLRDQGQPDLAARVWHFAQQMPPPRSEQELIAKESFSWAPSKRHVERPNGR